MLDTARTFETPEGVDLHLRVAGPIVRSLAWSIDALIRVAVYIVLSIVLTLFGEFGKGVLLLCIFLLEWFYPVFFEVLKNGATPGKKKMGIRVVNDNGTPVSWGTSITRNLLRTADFAPAFYGFGIIAMLLNSDFKRLGDMAAGTIVIYTSQSSTKSDIPVADAVSPPLSLSIKEQRAILDFAERSELLSVERREELANILPALTGVQGQQAVNKLNQYANWLYGNTNRK
ncbi:RDD family protein [Kaarinaea lacus]